MGDEGAEPQGRTGRVLDVTANLLGVTLPFAAVVVAVVLTWEHLTTWRDIAMLAVVYLPTSLGLTVGYHRMLTHRSFTAPAAVRFVLLALGCMSGTTDPLRWAAIHVQHHARADREGDPHSPLDGLFHAHIGWFVLGFDPDPHRFVPWLVHDPLIRFFQRTSWYWTALGFAVPFALGGWSGLLWGGGVRMFLTIHMAFSVNSVCHTFGHVAFRTGDRSRNQWFMGIAALGEGWHNNHHAFPRSAFHGLRWWQIDVSGCVIAALERCGLATDVHRVSPQSMQARRMPVGP
jgi:stearoyl-CoA desaturase (Delta-9 desaturase)